MINRKEEIKKKGFSMISSNDTPDEYAAATNEFIPIDFSKIKIGTQTLDDAIVKLGDLRKINPKLADKKNVLDAIHTNDYITMREISNFFYKTSGIYSRLCRYMTYLYKY